MVEDQRAWQQLEQLVLGQVRSPGSGGRGEGGEAWTEVLHPVPFPLPSQLEELKQQLDLQEEGLGQLHLGVVRLLVGLR